MILLGHLQGANQKTIHLAPDLKENLAKTDGFEAQIANMIDGFIAQTGMDAPPESLPVLRDGYEAAELAELNLETAAITTIIWATGYSFNFSMVKLPTSTTDVDTRTSIFPAENCCIISSFFAGVILL